ncbi:MAG: hypothetical protein Q4E45_02315 [Eubacteriales bacterium]|nr:hypothetical protein [Eubacteriales bacterium]
MLRVNFSKTGTLPDGTPVYDLYIGGELKAQWIPLDEVIRRILAFEEMEP